MNEYDYQVLDPLKDKVLCSFLRVLLTALCVCVFVFDLMQFKTKAHLCPRLTFGHTQAALNVEAVFICVYVRAWVGCVFIKGPHSLCTGRSWPLGLCEQSTSTHTQMPIPIFPWSPPSPPQWLTHSNAAVWRWRAQEVLSCNSVSVSSCGEVADCLPATHQNYQPRKWGGGEGKRGGVPLKCKITTAVQCGGQLPQCFPFFFFEAAILWWKECVFDGVWMCVRLAVSVRVCIYVSVFFDGV